MEHMAPAHLLKQLNFAQHTAHMVHRKRIKSNPPTPNIQCPTPKKVTVPTGDVASTLRC